MSKEHEVFIDFQPDIIDLTSKLPRVPDYTVLYLLGTSVGAVGVANFIQGDIRVAIAASISMLAEGTYLMWSTRNLRRVIGDIVQEAETLKYFNKTQTQPLAVRRPLDFS